MKLFSKLVSLLIVFVLFMSACSSSDDSTKDGFDRKAFLNEAVVSVILPSIETFYDDVLTLDQHIQTLVENPNESSLVVAQNSWKTAYLSWQAVSILTIGPASTEGLRKSLFEEMGTFPVSEEKIEQRIESGSYNLSDFDRDARGLFTIEYLLFGKPNPFDQKSITFLKAVSADALSRIEEVKTAWNDQQITDFIENNGTDAGSSTSEYYNEYVKSFEVLKNFKIGLPLGLRPGQTQAEPKLVEAFYSKSMSLKGAKYHFEQIKTIWLGPENGIGFKGYLRTVSGGVALIESTENQFAVVDSVFSRFIVETEILSELVAENDERVISLHTELQRLTRYLKSELSSLIGIAITYSSSDGD